MRCGQYKPFAEANLCVRICARDGFLSAAAAALRMGSNSHSHFVTKRSLGSLQPGSIHRDGADPTVEASVLNWPLGAVDNATGASDRCPGGQRLAEGGEWI